MQRVRKGDRVVVLTGRYRGVEGEILRVMPKDDRVIVQGVNMVKRHRRPGPGQAGGIEEREAAIHVSNVAHIDPDDGKPTRVGFKFIKDGDNERKVRVSKRSGEILPDPGR